MALLAEVLCQTTTTVTVARLATEMTETTTIAVIANLPVLRKLVPTA